VRFRGRLATSKCCLKISHQGNNQTEHEALKQSSPQLGTCTSPLWTLSLSMLWYERMLFDKPLLLTVVLLHAHSHSALWWLHTKTSFCNKTKPYKPLTMQDHTTPVVMLFREMGIPANKTNSHPNLWFFVCVIVFGIDWREQIDSLFRCPFSEFGTSGTESKPA
jgi:hypothetical protein